MMYSALLTGYAGNKIPAREIIIEKPVEEIQTEKIEETDPIEIIKNVADEYGIRQIDILAIAHIESLLGELQEGDSGCSKGWFHINTCANPTAEPVIGNVKTEAQWVVKKLLEYGYNSDIDTAIAKYNAPYAPNFDYLKRVKERKKYVTKYIQQENTRKGKKEGIAK